MRLHRGEAAAAPAKPRCSLFFSLLCEVRPFRAVWVAGYDRIVEPVEPITNANEAVGRAEDFLHRGEPILAFNAALAGLQSWADHARLRQLQALALARSGDAERANALLEKLAGEGLADGETLGMLARTHKDLAARATRIQRRPLHLEAAV